MKLKNRVVVTGMGCISALGQNLSECMENMFDGKRNVNPPSRFSTTHPIKYPVFEITDKFRKPEADRNHDLTLTAQMGIAATYQALSDAGYSKDYLKGKRVGVCMGTTVGCSLNNEEFYREYRDGKHPDMKPIKRFLNSNPSASISREFDLNGPLQTIVNACASGTDAIGIGTSWIKSGICDIVIAGGSDELCRVTYNGFISLMITDHEPCRPFDTGRNGLNLGEGAAVLILETEKTAENKTKCSISGYGSACDAYHLTAPKPDGSGLKKAISTALAQASISPNEIGFINAHGTGTNDNDKVESLVIGELMPNTPFFSTKGYTGHTLGAAGAIEAAFTIASIVEGKIPRSIGFSNRDEKSNVSPTKEEIAFPFKTAMSESVAFGGNNSVLIFSKDE
jgi:3-oxoacyl-[acyl-carrier-protein] synthase-1/3-oxoacyl-[acyl-carrier-protein] synthase II